MINQKVLLCYTYDLLHSHEYWRDVNEQTLIITYELLSNCQYEIDSENHKFILSSWGLIQARTVISFNYKLRLANESMTQ